MATALDPGKLAAAEAALALVEGGMRLGLGTGSTAAIFVDLLGARAKAEGLELVCVPTSSRTAAQAEALGLRIVPLDEAAPLDLVVDGADEADPALDLIKGGGGALLQEKIVAAAAGRMVVIADASKGVETLGAFPLPVEIVRFGWEATRNAVAALIESEDVDGRGIARRMAGDGPYVTDEGHYILDLSLKRIGDAPGLAQRLLAIPGVVETGLFIGLATELILGAPDGSVRRLSR